MKKTATLCMLIFIGLVAYNPVVAQDSNEDYLRPDAGQLGFFIHLSPITNSERRQIENLIGANDEVFSPIAMGLDLRYYLTEDIALRGGISFFNYRRKFEQTGSASNLSGIRDYQVSLGVMKAFGGTNRVEPYVFLDVQYGRTQVRSLIESNDPNDINIPNIGEGETERENLFSVFGATAGLGFNYYIAKNIALGAEIGVAVNTFTGLDESEGENITSFLSSANGKIGVSVFF